MMIFLNFLIHTHTHTRSHTHNSSNVLSVGPCIVVHQQDEHQPVSGLWKVDNSVHAPPSQVGQVSGAKNRKLGSVTRFKQVEAWKEHRQVHNGTIDKPGNEEAYYTQG